MKISLDPLELLYPSGKTVLMQHLQTLVLRGNPYWMGGIAKLGKLAGLVTKLASRYPLCRDERGRTYDRAKGMATTHLVVYPTAGGVAWWVLSSDGKGGLADPSTDDFKVAQHAMAATGHIEFEDYVLLYASRKDARTLIDARTGKEKKVLKDTSTWTWKLTKEAVNQVLASLDREVEKLNYGDEPRGYNAAYGVRGLLYYQRQRPLFSGVRAQIIEVHREALSRWGRMRKAWTVQHPKLAAQYGERAGQLIPIKELTSNKLPKMTRMKVFSHPKKRVRTLIGDD